MSKQWTIGIVAGILALCLVGMVGVAIGRASSFAAMNRAGMIQGPRGFDQPGQVERGGRFEQNPQAESRQIEVTLIDDDEDGVPDRGVIEMPAGPAFNRGFDGKFNNRDGPPQHFGRGFDPGRDQFNRVPIFPFGLLGSLLCLTVAGGLAVLGVVLYRRRSSPSPVAATSPVVNVPPVEDDTPEQTGTTPEEDETTEAETADDVEPESEDSQEAPAGEDDESDDNTPSGETQPAS